MADPPAYLPEYISLDEHSEWHTSALLCTAMETATLPSRLKSRNGLSSTLSELEDFLRSNGNQTLAKPRLEVEYSTKQNGHRPEYRSMSIPGSQRATGYQAQTRRGSNLESNTGIDLSLSSEEYDGVRSHKSAHIFSRAIVIRNEKDSENMLTNGERLSSQPHELPGLTKLQT